MCKLCLKLVAKQQGRTFIDNSSLSEISSWLCLKRDNKHFHVDYGVGNTKLKVTEEPEILVKINTKTTMTYLKYQSASDH